MPVKHPNGRLQEFPEDEWGEVYLKVAASKLPAEKALLDLDKIVLEDLSLDGECAEVAWLADKRREAGRSAAILQQDLASFGMVQPLFDIVGLEMLRPPRRDLIEWTDIVFDHINVATFRLKRSFNRPRPYNNCAELRVMPGVRRPEHASYPGGHATIVHTFARLLATVRPGKVSALDATAREIAINREIAGLHFPSDTRAGEMLAKILVDGMLRSDAPAAERFFELLGSLKQ